MQSKALTPFIFKVFLWLPFCYYFWYVSAPYSTIVTSYLTELLLKNTLGDLILGLEQTGHNIEVIVKATIAKGEVPKGMVAELPYPINPLQYHYGLPLCLALILSSSDSLLRKARNIVLSILLLLLVQLWGVYFDFLKSLFLQTPNHLIGNIILQNWQFDLIAICYQIGALVLPPVAPLIIWLFLYKNFVSQFIPAFNQPA
jgi:hypothetical protein